MKLVIVESPTKARTLKRYLGSGYSIEASMGHVRDLPKSKMGVDPEKDFAIDYATVKGKGTILTKLKKLAKTADTIVLATDPDREGEAIAWHVAEHLKKGRGVSEKKLKRVTFHEITKDAILEALKQPGSINTELVDAQQARRVVDRLVGYSLSPVLWKKVRRGLSAGRVQSVALKLIVEKEKEIEAFDAQEYWMIVVALSDSDVSSAVEKKILAAIDDEKSGFNSLENMSKEGVYLAELYEIDGKRVVVKGSDQDKGNVTYVDSKAVAEPISKALKHAKYVVTSIEKTERKRHPRPPFTTSTLQQAAASRLSWSGKQTMRIAQQLYEAGHITYHRTDSFSLSKQAIEAAREYVEAHFSAKHLPEKPKVYKTSSKNAQEAHEAVRPTVVATGGTIDSLNAQQAKLYRLIWQRMVASQMAAAIYDQTTILTKATAKNTYTLKTTGSVTTFDGWLAVYGGARGGGDNELPSLSVDQDVNYINHVADKKETLPPPRFNDASLVKELEKRGIGRPSTYASIISVIVDRGYVDRRDKRFYPTVVGKTVVEFLDKHFTDVMDYDFTAHMEDDLDAISRGEKDWKKVMKEFWNPFNKRLEKAEDAERAVIPVEKTGKKCPECKDGEVVIRTGRYGKFYSCSNYSNKENKCDYTENIIVTVPDVVCPLCQKGEVVEKNTRWGKMFYGCSRYATKECDWASWKKPEKGDKVTKKEWAEYQKKREARKKVWAERRAKAEANKKAKKKS